MPFICLTRDDVPDGTLQILDLKPNTSLRVPAMDAPGQTKYVNRVQRDPVEFDATGRLGADAKGLAAYLADRVLPGGLEAAHAHVTSALPVHGDSVTIAGVPFTVVDNYATATVTLNTPAVDDNIVIAGVQFTAKAAENIPLMQFDQSGAVGAQAISLAACINGAAAQAAFLAANPAVGVRPAMSVTAVVDGVIPAQVNLTVTIRGIDGDALGLVVTEAVPGTIVPSGATFDWVAADVTACEFQGYLGVASHTDDDVALSLVASINDATPVTGGQALLDAAITALGYPGEHVSAAAALHVVTVTYGTVGAHGLDVSFVSSNATRLAVASTLTGFLGFTVTMPTQTQYANAANAIVTRLDSGLALALANINAAISGPTKLGTAGLTTGGSTGSVQDVLSILAGREYAMPVQAQKFPSGVWDATELGSFTHIQEAFGTHMITGEWKPANMPFDPTPVENKPIRATYDGSSFQLSVSVGALSKMAAGVTLFPDSDLVEFHVSQHQKGQPHPQVNGARLVTVYADDGTVIV